jgi:hypothetical protein
MGLAARIKVRLRFQLNLGRPGIALKDAQHRGWLAHRRGCGLDRIDRLAQRDAGRQLKDNVMAGSCPW